MFYVDITLNLSLLVALTIVSGFIEDRWSGKPRFTALLQGLLFAAVAVLGMMRPVNMGDGLIFDGRSVVISLAALFYGPLAALPATLIPLVVRISMGGSGVYMAILVILSSAIIGLLFRSRMQPEKKPPKDLDLYLFGLSVHILMVASMAALPSQLILGTMRRIGPAVIVLYPLATVLAGRILANLVHNRNTLKALRTSEQRFRDSIEYLPVPIGIADKAGRILHLNRAFTETFGYTVDDTPTIESWSVKAYPDPLYRKRGMQRWLNAIEESDTSGNPVKQLEYTITCKNGEVSIVIISTQSQEGLLVTVFEDVTERKHREELLRRKLRELADTREATINSMAIISEFRDTDTGAHIQRTKLYVKLMLEKMGPHCPYEKDAVELIWHSAPLHDIGKVAIPDSILLKPGKLTDDEFAEMKKHPIYGSTAIRRTEEILADNSFLNYASEIAEFHHEKWDGTGYPHGLKAEQIPLSARIMAIADVYDACISARPYKPPIPHNDVVKIICNGSGTHFDPALVRIFEDCHTDFFRIANEYRD